MSSADTKSTALETTGETKLNTLLRTMSPKLYPETYVWVNVPHPNRDPSSSSNALASPLTYLSTILPPTLPIQMLFCEPSDSNGEGGGITIITTLDAAVEHKLAYTFVSKMITLQVHSSLDAVGFMAHITTRLARDVQIGVNPVSGFFHDHLFVSEERAEEVMGVLWGIVSDAQ